MASEDPDRGDYDVVGLRGVSDDCFQWLAVVLEFAPFKTLRALLVTNREFPVGPSREHLFVLVGEDIEYPRFAVIRDGFSSGYLGAGPMATSRALLLLYESGIDVETRDVDADLFWRVNEGAATHDELSSILNERSRWRGSIVASRLILDRAERIAEERSAWAEWTEPRLVRSLVCPDLQHLAREFSSEPRERLLRGFRLLESRVRGDLARLGADPGEKTGSGLMSLAFSPDKGLLGWADVAPGSGEHNGRFNLLTGAFTSLRNPPAHREELNRRDSHYVSDFLLLNRLFEWVLDAQPRAELSPSG